MFHSFCAFIDRNSRQEHWYSYFFCVECKNWANHVEITTRYLFAVFFKRERKRTRNHSIACSFACSSAQNAGMLVSGVLLLSTVKKLDHTCSFFWAHFFLQFFPPVILPWSTLAKVDIFGPMFSAAFSYSTWCNINKKPSKNHIGGNRNRAKMPWIACFSNLPCILPTPKRVVFPPSHQELTCCQCVQKDMAFAGDDLGQALMLLSSEMMRLNTWRMASRPGSYKHVELDRPGFANGIPENS